VADTSRKGNVRHAAGRGRKRVQQLHGSGAQPKRAKTLSRAAASAVVDPVEPVWAGISQTLPAPTATARAPSRAEGTERKTKNTFRMRAARTAASERKAAEQQRCSDAAANKAARTRSARIARTAATARHAAETQRAAAARKAADAARMRAARAARSAAAARNANQQRGADVARKAADAARMRAHAAAAARMRAAHVRPPQQATGAVTQPHATCSERVPTSDGPVMSATAVRAAVRLPLAPVSDAVREARIACAVRELNAYVATAVRCVPAAAARLLTCIVAATQALRDVRRV
jgi:hypothetical protein